MGAACSSPSHQAASSSPEAEPVAVVPTASPQAEAKPKSTSTAHSQQQQQQQQQQQATSSQSKKTQTNSPQTTNNHQQQPAHSTHAATASSKNNTLKVSSNTSSPHNSLRNSQKSSDVASKRAKAAAAKRVAERAGEEFSETDKDRPSSPHEKEKEKEKPAELGTLSVKNKEKQYLAEDKEIAHQNQHHHHHHNNHHNHQHKKDKQNKETEKLIANQDASPVVYKRDGVHIYSEMLNKNNNHTNQQTTTTTPDHTSATTPTNNTQTHQTPTNKNTIVIQPTASPRSKSSVTTAGGDSKEKDMTKEELTQLLREMNQKSASWVDQLEQANSPENQAKQSSVVPLPAISRRTSTASSISVSTANTTNSHQRVSQLHERVESIVQEKFAEYKNTVKMDREKFDKDKSLKEENGSGSYPGLPSFAPLEGGNSNTPGHTENVSQDSIEWAKQRRNKLLAQQANGDTSHTLEEELQKIQKELQQAYINDKKEGGVNEKDTDLFATLSPRSNPVTSKPNADGTPTSQNSSNDTSSNSTTPLVPRLRINTNPATNGQGTGSSGHASNTCSGGLTSPSSGSTAAVSNPISPSNLRIRTNAGNGTTSGLPAINSPSHAGNALPNNSGIGAPKLVILSPKGTPSPSSANGSAHRRSTTVPTKPTNDAQKDEIASKRAQIEEMERLMNEKKTLLLSPSNANSTASGASGSNKIVITHTRSQTQATTDDERKRLLLEKQKELEKMQLQITQEEEEWKKKMEDTKKEREKERERQRQEVAQQKKLMINLMAASNMNSQSNSPSPTAPSPNAIRIKTATTLDAESKTETPKPKIVISPRA